MKRFILLIIVLTLVLSCDLMKENYGKIEGTVVWDNGVPVDSVNVLLLTTGFNMGYEPLWVVERTIKTDSAGYFCWNKVETQYWKIKLSFHDTNYEGSQSTPESYYVKVEKNETEYCDFVISR
ncbi:MAG TPA: hypothetical protein PLD62_09510 [Candidatus Cloacimonadota bacterium]|nr:hypothetical protein [Candidatus Cloacimonadota bacterium]